MRRLAISWSQLTTLSLSLAVVAALGTVVLVAGPGGVPSVTFTETGHWVFNRVERVAFHVDSGTRQVDARVAVPAAAGDPVMLLQGHKEGFLVGRDAVSVFGKSTLTVDPPIPTDQSELPVGIEVVGGPYLVYRQSGTLVRLGEPRASVQVGGPVGNPVATRDGTVWVHRPDNGDLCALHREAATLDCAVRTPTGIAGTVVVVSALPAFVNTTVDAVQVVDSAALRPAVAAGVDLPDQAMPADEDSRGRLAVVVPDPNRLLLLDTAGVTAGRPGGAPIAVDLGAGRFSRPAVDGDVVAVIEQDAHQLRTFDLTGKPLSTVDLPPGTVGTIVRGEDGRLYVDDPQGTKTHTVEPDGSVTTVATGTTASTAAAAAVQPPVAPPSLPTPPRRTTAPARVDRPLPPAKNPGPDPAQPKPQPVLKPQPVPQPEPKPQPVPEPTVVVPKAPTGLVATWKGDRVAVSWRPVGGEVDHYTVVLNGKAVTTATGTSATVTGPTTGTARVAVSATNSAGTGPLSAAVSVAAVVGKPGAPTNLHAGQGSGMAQYQLSAGWTAPDLHGGELEHYLLTYTADTGKARSVTTTATSVKDLPADYCETPYTVAVRAVTRPPGGGPTQTGPAATTKSDNGRSAVGTAC